MAAYRPLFWRAACAVFVCEGQRRHWLARGLFARRNRVIYNGVDHEHWQPVDATALRRALGFAETDYVVGLSAVLRPEKNPVQLIDALARLRAMGLPARALFIGDGEERGAVESRARALGVADRFVISGFQEDVRPFISACDVVALTSFTEAFSLAAIEAMALGRPVVHPDVGGAAEMIHSGQDGWLFPVGDTATLVDRLAVLADPVVRTRLGENARATVARCIRSLDACRRAFEGVDIVLHEAALGSVPRSIDDPIASSASNVSGFINMLVAARDAGVERFVYASSSAVYGDHPALPKVEAITGRAMSPYGLTKQVNELYADVFDVCYGYKTIGLRYFNVFGPRQDPNGAYASVIPAWIGALLRGQVPYINGDGAAARDFCYVDNVVQANLLAATVEDPAALGQAYNSALGDQTSLVER